VIANLIPRESTLTFSGSVPLRLELRTLQQNADQWNLYLLGLDAFKKTDETSDLSYYGICGEFHSSSSMFSKLTTVGIHGTLSLSSSPFAPEDMG
jgi:hypothetical protein